MPNLRNASFRKAMRGMSMAAAAGISAQRISARHAGRSAAFSAGMNALNAVAVAGARARKIKYGLGGAAAGVGVVLAYKGAKAYQKNKLKLQELAARIKERAPGLVKAAGNLALGEAERVAWRGARRVVMAKVGAAAGPGAARVAGFAMNIAARGKFIKRAIRGSGYNVDQPRGADGRWI